MRTREIRSLREREGARYLGNLSSAEWAPIGPHVSRLGALGWTASTSLRAGLAQTYRWYCENAEP